ncbi:MAG: tetratricopeptide repeat protein [Anaerolineae bacterium]
MNDLLLNQAKIALKEGRRVEARLLLVQLIQQDRYNEEAWLWLSGAVDGTDERRKCLEQILTINPSNELALRGLKRLEHTVAPTADQAPVADPTPQPTAAAVYPAKEPPLAKAEGTESVDTAQDVDSKAHAREKKLLGCVLASSTLILVGAVLAIAIAFTPLRDHLAKLIPGEPKIAVLSTPQVTHQLDDPTAISTWTPTPLSAVIFTATPTPLLTEAPTTIPMPTDTGFVPGDPTATPLGENIVDSNYLLGKEAYEAKDYAQVLILMDLVLEANPNLAPPHWYRGMAYFYLGDYESGLLEMEQALAIDPEYALAYADRGLLYAAMGDLDKAMADWERALELDPSLAKVHHNMGAMYFNQGDYYRALEQYGLAVAIDPTRAVSWLNHSGTLMELGRYRDCIDSASRAIELDPEQWEAYYNRGTCQAFLENYLAAKQDLEFYVAAVQDDPEAWYNLGICHRYLGEDQQAIECYSKAIELDPTHTWALINRGNVYISMAEYEQALADYKSALEYGAIPAAYRGCGDAYYGLEDYDQAIINYQRAIELLPNYADAYGGLARTYLAQGRHEEAVEVANQALTLAPGSANSPIILQTRGRAYYELGNYEQAILDFTRIIETHPSVMDYYYRGIAYQANGQLEEAIQDLEYFVSQATSRGTFTEEVQDAQAKLTALKD